MKKFIHFILLLLGIVLFTQKGFSFNTSQPEFHQISYMQGLPGTNVTQQIQDQYGIMWIAVEASGVCRYDGHKFINFKHDPNDTNSISSNFIEDLIEDKYGNIWIATLDGLNKYIRRENKFVSYKNTINNPLTIQSNVCNTLYFEDNDYLWIGTATGLSKMDVTNETFENFNVIPESEKKHQHLSVNAIHEYPKGIFWLGTNQGLIQYQILNSAIKSWYNRGQSNNEPIHQRINCLVADSSNNLWIGTHRGLDRFNMNTLKFTHWNFDAADLPALEKEGINSFLFDSNENIWAGTYTKGLIVIDPRTDNYYQISKETGGKYPLRSNHVKYIIEDNVGSFWVGTKFEGIFKLNKSINIFDKWPESLSLLNELSTKYFMSFYEDKNDVYWLGSKNDGLFKVDIINQQIKNYAFNSSVLNSIASNRVHSVIRDQNNRLWVGTNLGLQLMNENDESFSTIKNISVNDLYIDKRSTLWVGTTEGLYFVNDKTHTLEFFSSAENNSYFFQNNMLNILDIFQDTRGLLWFTSREQGVFCYDETTIELKHYMLNEATENGLNSNMTRFCFEDSRGFIWIGTKAGGLNKFDPFSSSFSNYMIDDGLPSNLILSMQEDNDSNLWIGTHNGISKFNVKHETFENFNSDYGLQSNISEPGVNWKFKNGELLFGGNNGFNVFYPNDIKKIESNTPVLITAVKVLNELVKQDIDSVTQIMNKHDENFISFEFTLMDFNYPFRHNYEYMLEGFDADWIKNGNRNYASYTSLPPGEYSFNVKAANELGNWSDLAPVCQIVIKPPFYKIIWFQLFVLFLLFSLAYIAYRRKMNSINSTKIKLEGMISERTNKLTIAFDEINKQKKEIEHHQTILEKRVQERTADLELAKKKAEESDLLKSSFLANMSHEIRTPLNAICGFSSMITDDSIDNETKEEFSEIINNNSNQLLKLIEDILDISKMDAGQIKIEKRNFNLNSLLSGIFKTYNEELKMNGKSDVKLLCPVLDDKHLNFNLYSDQYRLKQVLVNLINNAIKFTDKGFIEYGYKVDGTFLHFYVTDTGIGISEENLSFVFNRFTKIEKLNSIYGGTGIGLSISKSIVELFGGELTIESALGKGSTFSFTFPFSQEEEK